MGVKGLWSIVSPVGVRVNPEILTGKRIAIDVSIWLYELTYATNLKSFKNTNFDNISMFNDLWLDFSETIGEIKSDNLKKAHLYFFFLRICKLLYYNIRPIFVFDGTPPELKKKTIFQRNLRKRNYDEKFKKTAEKLIYNYYQNAALQSLKKGKLLKEKGKGKGIGKGKEKEKEKEKENEKEKEKEQRETRINEKVKKNKKDLLFISKSDNQLYQNKEEEKLIESSLLNENDPTLHKMVEHLGNTKITVKDILDMCNEDLKDLEKKISIQNNLKEKENIEHMTDKNELELLTDPIEEEINKEYEISKNKNYNMAIIDNKINEEILRHKDLARKKYYEGIPQHFKGFFTMRRTIDDIDINDTNMDILEYAKTLKKLEDNYRNTYSENYDAFMKGYTNEYTNEYTSNTIGLPELSEDKTKEDINMLSTKENTELLTNDLWNVNDLTNIKNMYTKNEPIEGNLIDLTNIYKVKKDASLKRNENKNEIDIDISDILKNKNIENINILEMPNNGDADEDMLLNGKDEYKTYYINDEEVKIPLFKEINKEVFDKLPNQLQYQILQDIKVEWYEDNRRKALNSKDDMDTFAQMQLETYVRMIKTDFEIEKLKIKMAEHVHNVEGEVVVNKEISKNFENFIIKDYNEIKKKKRKRKKYVNNILNNYYASVKTGNNELFINEEDSYEDEEKKENANENISDLPILHLESEKIKTERLNEMITLCGEHESELGFIRDCHKSKKRLQREKEKKKEEERIKKIKIEKEFSKDLLADDKEIFGENFDLSDIICTDKGLVTGDKHISSFPSLNEQSILNKKEIEASGKDSFSIFTKENKPIVTGTNEWKTKKETDDYEIKEEIIPPSKTVVLNTDSSSSDFDNCSVQEKEEKSNYNMLLNEEENIKIREKDIIEIPAVESSLTIEQSQIIETAAKKKEVTTKMLKNYHEENMKCVVWENEKMEIKDVITIEESDDEQGMKQKDEKYMENERVIKSVNGKEKVIHDGKDITKKLDLEDVSCMKRDEQIVIAIDEKYDKIGNKEKKDWKGNITTENWGTKEGMNKILNRGEVNDILMSKFHTDENAKKLLINNIFSNKEIMDTFRTDGTENRYENEFEEKQQKEKESNEIKEMEKTEEKTKKEEKYEEEAKKEEKYDEEAKKEETYEEETQKEEKYEECDFYENLEDHKIIDSYINETNKQNNELMKEFRKLKKNNIEINEDVNDDIKILLNFFGIPYIQSPCEAEAQCSYLNNNNYCDAIISDDSDVLVFNGNTVIKNFFNKKKTVEIYEQKLIEQKLGLSQNDLINISLLCGCDYTIGVHGIGIVNALEVIKAFPTFDDLKKFKEIVSNPFRKIDESYNEDIKHFLTTHKNYKMNWIFPSNFPDKEVYKCFKFPKVLKDIKKFQWSFPNLDHITKFLNQATNVAEEKIFNVLNPILEKYNVKVRTYQLKIEDFFPIIEKKKKNVHELLDIIKKTQQEKRKRGSVSKITEKENETEKKNENKKEKKKKKKEEEEEEKEKEKEKENLLQIDDEHVSSLIDVHPAGIIRSKRLNTALECIVKRKSKTRKNKK